MRKTEQPQKFDMVSKPGRQKAYLKPVTWLLSYPSVWKRRAVINKINMDGLKPPYLLLCTHMAFLDFKVTTAAIFPHRANYVVAIDGFIGREGLMRKVGCICKRKFTNDIRLVQQIKHVITVNKDILVLYPEARYSLAGTNAILPESLGKLVKLLKVPVVVLNLHGHYLQSPCWNLSKRKNRIEADMTQILTQQEISELSYKEIFDRINDAFYYDEYEWQRNNNIRIRHKNNAKGLHKILYQCPHCLTEYQMNSEGNRIWCECCGKEWRMTELGTLEAVTGLTEFPHIPDWYEFERMQVQRQINNGTYSFVADVIIDSLPNSKGYIRLGPGKLVHDCNGFVLEGNFGEESFQLIKEPLSMYSCHIEFDYQGKGDCIDLSTLEDTYYIYPQGKQYSVTKISLATEELYKKAFEERRAKKREEKQTATAGNI